ncbi:MAG: hypothetical protein D3906_00865 [Candidatus Electrothrix sp. AUS1_2]|nr:hypothetical protein [Candidatus Electrothrix sp. AUS1_2]
MSDEKNVFVTSHNQMGGITANTVNFGPTARSMNEQLGQQLKDNIPTEAKVTVTSVLGDGEAFGFANQVLEWLKLNDFNRAEGVNQAVYTQPVMGQHLNKKSDDEYDLIIGARQ